MGRESFKAMAFCASATLAPKFWGSCSSGRATPTAVARTQARIRLGILRVQRDGFLIHLPRLDIGLFRVARLILHPAQEVVIGLQVVGAFRASPALVT